MKVLNKITDEYLEDILARLAHNSSAIEGNTLSYNQTVSIVLNNVISGNVNLREFYEVMNHKYAFEYMLDELKNGNKLDLYIVKNINKKLMDHLSYDRGEFKKNHNAIKGADFETATPAETPQLMLQWVDNLNYRLKKVNSEEDKIKIILEEHIKFERIHPFSDGNGRTGRIIMIYSLLEHNLVPFIIPVEDKQKYYNILSEQNTEEFYNLVKPFLEFEKKRMNAFYNKEKNKINYNFER